MAIILNDNLDVRAPKAVDNRYLNSSAAPYTNVAAVNAAIPVPYRYIGLTVNVAGVEYWYQAGTADANLVLKTAGAGGNASGERIEKTFTQAGHGFSLTGGTVVVGYDGTTWQAATASIGSVEPLGVVRAVSGNSFTVVFHGYFNFSGTSFVDEGGIPLSASTVYFLSRNNAGKLTKTPLTNVNDIDKPMLITLSNNDCLVVNYRGAIITTGTTTSTGLTVTWDSVTDKPLLITGGSSISNVGLGAQVYYGLTGTTHGFRTLIAGIGMGITENGDTITFNSSGGTGGTIGVPDDGTYLDGLFPFTSGTTVANAIDPINQVLKALAPSEAPSLSNINSSSTFVGGKVSFGASHAISGYANVTTAAGNLAVDANGVYQAGGTRLGIINANIVGVLNSNVVGNTGGAGIPYGNFAFTKGNEGSLQMYLNGVLTATLSLSGTTAATSNSFFSVGGVLNVKFANGTDFSAFKYRTGSYTVPTANMTQGFNYVRIIHNRGVSSVQTNYLEWVYDNNANNIAVSGTSLNLVMGGTRNMSGVNYHTSGTATYAASYSNVYRNVYSQSTTAISFPTRTNLGTMTLMNVTGNGLDDRLSSALATIPDLTVGVPLAETYAMIISASLPINSTKVLGSVGSTGTISSNSSVNHPFAAKSFTGGAVSSTGYLMYNVTATSTDKTEAFNTETYRLQAVDYTSIVYADIDGGTYAWSSTQSLVGASAPHNTGLLFFDGQLLYPNAAYLTTTYGITTGNFGAVANGPGGNPNYSAASGLRSLYRKFKSTNVATQSTLTFQITHTGTLSNFMTDGGTGGTPTGNNVKVEFMIKRANGSTYGWANPFASSGNPDGIANTAMSQVGNLATVTCTLSTTPRVSNTDIVVVRIFTASGWSNLISGITIQNI